jgi:hypothetical protein
MTMQQLQQPAQCRRTGLGAVSVAAMSSSERTLTPCSGEEASARSPHLDLVSPVRFSASRSLEVLILGIGRSRRLERGGE